VNLFQQPTNQTIQIFDVNKHLREVLKLQGAGEAKLRSFKVQDKSVLTKTICDVDASGYISNLYIVLLVSILLWDSINLQI
jgi:hypothetical protein